MKASVPMGGLRLFVTGGTGFVGSHFVACALAAGHRVTALRRPGSAPRIPLAPVPDWLDGGLDGDWSANLRGHDVLVHFAAHSANPPYDALPACLQWNVQWPLRLAEQARQAGVQRYLVAGSCFEYGHVDPARLPIEVDTPLAPNNAYATSKAAASIAFLGMARQFGLQLQLLRIFHVYGPGEPASRLWPSLHRAAMAGQDFPMTPGAQVRDFVPVEQVASAFVNALAFEGVRPGEPQIAHVASGQPRTLLAFAEQWWQIWRAAGHLLPGAVPYRDGEVMSLTPAPGTVRR
jgi:nucleoside-diphosphate-sugar epimerase